ncbi:MAG TPA: hypothetical protein VG734_14465 [Lacunisphaera sp.]|nr:hypothetical protein [Lacunisphaera sp.]
MQLPRGSLLILAGLAAAYVCFLAWYHCPYAGGSDSSGYMNSARLLLAGRVSTPVRVPHDLGPDVLPRTYLYPLGFRLDEKQQNLVPTYPVGLPLHFAAIGWFIGLEPAATVVAIVSALGFAILLYFTGREFGARPGWAVALMLLGAVSPLVLLYSLQAMSDLLAAAWTLAVIFCALRSERHAGWAAGAGAALAVAVLVRPTSVLLFVPASIALRRSPRTWIAFALGGLPGAVFLAAYNRALYGSYLTSGYGDVSSLFAWRHVGPSLRNYATWVPVLGTPLILAACVLPWLKLDGRRKATLLAWAGVILAFYAAYEPTQETWWYLRFVLPALPALGIAAILALQQFAFPVWIFSFRQAPADPGSAQASKGLELRLPATLLLMLATAGWMFHWDRALRVSQVELDERIYPEVGRWVAGHVPPDAIVAAYQVSGTLLYYTDRAFINPVTFAPEDAARFGAWLDRNQVPLYAVLFPFEEAEALRRLPGHWETVTRIRHATVWRRSGPAITPASSPR